MRGKVIIVFGPPGAGKSTYIKNIAKDNELIVDRDDIKTRITGSTTPGTPAGYYNIVEKAFYNSVLKAIRTNKTTYVPVTAFSVLKRLFPDTGEIIIMVPPKIQVLNQIRNDKTRVAFDAWMKIIDDWYRWWYREGEGQVRSLQEGRGDRGGQLSSSNVSSEVRGHAEL